MLSYKSSRHSLVIQANDNNNPSIDVAKEIERYIQWLLSINAISYYALILHDKDIKEFDASTGVAVDKTPHYHLLLEFTTCRAADSVLNSFVKYCPISKTIISFRVVKDWISANQYLIHLNQVDKAKYDISEVITNNLDTYNDYVNGRDKANLDFDNLYKLCSSYDRIKVYSMIGLENAKRYKYVIDDIYKYLHS